MSDGPDAKVFTLAVTARSGAPKTPLRVVHKSGCFHRGAQYEIDSRGRTVTCGKCHVSLDPFFVLDMLSRDSERLVAAWKAREQIEKEVRELTETRNRLRASVRGMVKRRAAP